MKRMKKADFFLIGGILLAGCLAALCLFLFSEKGDYVQVRVSGEVIASYPLSQNAEYEIKGTNGKNILVIRDGEAWIEDASCPDKLCKKQGHISKNGQSVICLPNQITVEIVSGDKTGSDRVDAVAG